jgi:hypothetical protein
MGTVAVTEKADGSLAVFGTLTGLEMYATGGIHIHAGVSCASASDVGGLYVPGSSNPWTATTYSTNGVGVSNVAFSVDDFSVSGTNPVRGRVMVVHDSSGAGVACAVLASTAGEVVSLNTYPGYSGMYQVAGTVHVKPTFYGVSITGTIGNLETSTSGGIHIHDGYSVAVSAGIGGLFRTGSPNPWAATMWTTDLKGSSEVSFMITNYTLRNGQSVTNHGMVVHLSDGTAASAGLVSTVSAVDAASELASTFSPTLGPTFMPTPADTADVAVAWALTASAAASDADAAQLEADVVAQLGYGPSAVKHFTVTSTEVVTARRQVRGRRALLQVMLDL